MSKATSVYAAFAALLAAVDARNLHQPRATAASGFDFGGFSPKPTSAPDFPFHQALQRRAGSSSSPTVVYVAPDATCGFISGLPGAGYTCGVGATCVFFTASQSSQAPGRVACCNSNECNARNVCIDYNGYFSQSKCDNGCAVDTFTLKCTSTEAPYCNTISFPGDIMDVFCNNVNITGIQAALTTYRGESSRTFRPLTLTDNEATTTSDDSTSTSPTPSSSPSASGTGGGSNGDDNNGSSGDNDNGSKNGGGSKSNTGAIVGGVVGGVGGLALIGLAVFFFLRRRNSAAAGHEPVSQNAPPPVVYPAPGMQQNPQAYYDPNAAATGQQPYPPNQQYGQQGFYPPHPSVSPDQSTSPTGSHIDPRYSVAPSSTSPAPSGGYVAPVAGGFQPHENVIHEAPAAGSDNHRGEMHELA
ncbi:hypothetical protein TGAM01_v210208 [Trichoderma gamsii]|uniref:Uncharacterized protein n=1 Tax=Trichoderma gamsii TaxID=398673 RepID=A0A2P4Z9E9_9HYPO|nr:hypothetical protein TGAM01_v210208 [Trichoderma gamsii]PON20923.1 hypothetical protein TGAM01_v210208 [Trichoderma gamsii]